MEIEYGLTLEDIEAFARFHLKHGPKLKPDFVSYLFGVALFIGMVVSINLTAWFSEQPDAQWISAFCGGCFAGILITGILAALLQRYLMVLNTRRLYNTKESRWFLAWRRLKITASGIEITNNFEQLHYSWPAVCLIDSTDNHAFFYSTPHQAHIIPRRAFRDSQDFEEFIDLACRYHEDFASPESTSTEIPDALPAEETGITLRRQP